MTKPTIRLDTSKPYAGCHGERTPDDPHYRVHFWQGQKVGGAMVLLPFDAQGELVPDDGKTAPYPGFSIDGKPVMHQPLYTAAMRLLVEQKTKRLAAGAKAAAQADAEQGDEADADDNAADKAGTEVNFVSWLRGEADYQPHVLRAAAKARYSRNFAKISDIVVDLVLDEKVVPESAVCPRLAVHLPAAAA